MARVNLDGQDPRDQATLSIGVFDNRGALFLQSNRQLLRRLFLSRYTSSTTTTPSNIASLLSERPGVGHVEAGLSPGDNHDVVVNGWVRSVRKQKRIAFAAVGDGSTLEPLQVVLSPELSKDLDTGTAVRIRGSIKASPGKGQTHELIASELSVLSDNTVDPATYPLQKKYQSTDFLRQLPHLRPRTPFNTLLLRLRSHAISRMSCFLSSQHFIQTHPPILTSSDCEGAGKIFSVTTESSLSSIDRTTTPPSSGTGEDPFFGHPSYLTVSTQLHLEALAQAHPRVWTLSPTFRAERSDTPRHLSEFYMLELEMSFIDSLSSLTSILQSLLRDLASSLLSGSSSIGKDLLCTPHRPEEHPSPSIAARLESRWETLASPDPWPTITYTHAISLLQSAPKSTNFTYPPTWGVPLQSEHERYLACTVFSSPVFITNYPLAIKPFYMLPSTTSIPISSNDDAHAQTAANFDLILPSSSTLELAGGSLRHHSLSALQASMKARGIDPSPLQWYIDLRKWGSTPHGGFGMGFDRLLAYLAHVDNVKDVVTWPRWAGRCSG